VNHYSYRGQNHSSYREQQSFTTMDEITYTAEQREALKAANLMTNRVPLYYNHGRLSKAAIQGLVEHGCWSKRE
jgi:hypothetical protein